MAHNATHLTFGVAMHWGSQHNAGRRSQDGGPQPPAPRAQPF